MSFPPGALTFLRQLARNNRKEWFEEHRARYERDVKEPLVALVEEVDARLGDVAPEIVGDRRRSVFRIHRDVRFAKDKSPYKTNAAVWFYHRDVPSARSGGTAGGNVHGGAGFYFQLAPGDCWSGGGMWMPARPALQAIRDRIAARPVEWEALLRAPSFRRRFGALDAEAVLTRVPRGFAPDHPAGEWLRYQSFTAGRAIPDADVLKPGLADRLVKDFAAMLPLVRWLNLALGLAPAERR
ncbi:DUF2461 domain-containing protein [Roseisolibacter sp. H3M3-2]|uniref:DUF2461 domain-containing protein n=1 Tax=Roseisolibacter sp. H3M3-2 TaxID=3031323 RepID=UPI0023DA150E|nr:DUF2461 domain-containing protein [Roseisolibacter sp. H3M3-2]MDF1501595.1 DUF2461 domain-containing protein [Roseisolibacter sp. H3M3-2]